MRERHAAAKAAQPEVIRDAKFRGREAVLAKEGFYRVSRYEIVCVECGKTSHSNATRKGRKHEPSCSKYERPIVPYKPKPKPKPIPEHKQTQREKDKRKYQQRLSRLGRNNINAVDRERYRRGILAEGWEIIGDCIVCPVCRYEGKVNAPWRHYADCKSNLRGRRVNKLQ